MEKNLACLKIYSGFLKHAWFILSKRSVERLINRTLKYLTGVFVLQIMQKSVFVLSLILHSGGALSTLHCKSLIAAGFTGTDFQESVLKWSNVRFISVFPSSLRADAAVD